MEGPDWRFPHIHFHCGALKADLRVGLSPKTASQCSISIGHTKVIIYNAGPADLHCKPRNGGPAHICEEERAGGVRAALYVPQHQAPVHIYVASKSHHFNSRLFIITICL